MLSKYADLLNKLDAMASNPLYALRRRDLRDAEALIAKQEEEIGRLKELIDRDRTGLAKALNGVRQVLQSHYWIPLGEWGSYEWNERTENNFRAEIKRAFDEAENIAVAALRASGDLANEAFHGPKKITEEK